MTFRMYMLFMAIGTLISWLTWVFVVWNTDPFAAGLAGFVMFYVTLLMGLIGTLTLLGVTYRVLILKRKDVITREVRVSFRHALFLSAIAVISLGISVYGWLHWWAVLILVAVMSMVEFLFLLRDESRRI